MTGRQPVRRAFLSFSTVEADVAADVAEACDAIGVGCFYAPRDIHTGQNYAREIMRAIRECEVIVLLLSPTALKSVHVRRELTTAVEKDKKILPFALAGLRYPHDVDDDEWSYWLSAVQVSRYTSAADVAKVVSRSVLVAKAVAEIHSSPPPQLQLPHDADGWPSGSVARFTAVVHSFVARGGVLAAEQYAQLVQIAKTVEASWITDQTVGRFVDECVVNADVHRADAHEVETSGPASEAEELREWLSANGIDVVDESRFVEAVTDSLHELVGGALTDRLTESQLEELIRLQDSDDDDDSVGAWIAQRIPDIADIAAEQHASVMALLLGAKDELNRSRDPVADFGRLMAQSAPDEMHDSLEVVPDPPIRRAPGVSAEALSRELSAIGFQLDEQSPLAEAILDTIHAWINEEIEMSLNDTQIRQLHTLDSHGLWAADSAGRSAGWRWIVANVPDRREIVSDNEDIALGLIAEHMSALSESKAPVRLWRELAKSQRSSAVETLDPSTATAETHADTTRRATTTTAEGLLRELSRYGIDSDLVNSENGSHLVEAVLDTIHAGINSDIERSLTPNQIRQYHALDRKGAFAVDQWGHSEGWQWVAANVPGYRVIVEHHESTKLRLLANYASSLLKSRDPVGLWLRLASNFGTSSHSARGRH